MKPLKRSLIIGIIILTTASGCKKYPDGPIISLRTKEHRIVGNWEVESFLVNGDDSTSFLKSFVFYGNYQLKKGDYGSGEFIYKSSDNSYTSVGSWIFLNHKKDLELSLAPYNPAYHIGPFGAADIIWQIRRLKENELWLKTNYNNKEYFIKFKQ